MIARSLIMASLALSACANEQANDESAQQLAPLETDTPPEKEPVSAADFIYEAGGESDSVRCRDGVCINGTEPARSTTAPTETRPVHSSLVAAQLGSDQAESKTAVLEALKARPADEVVTLTLWLWEPEWDITELRENRRNDEIRHKLIDERKAQLAESQARASADVERLGGKVIGSEWLINSLVVEIGNESVAKLLDVQPVYGAYLPVAPATTAALGDADGADRLLAFNPLGIAEIGQITPHDNNMRLGILEAELLPNGDPNLLNYGHKGWLDTGSGTPLDQRIKFVKGCSYSGCAPDWVGTSSTHGTLVTSVATGSIQDGQDTITPYPGTNTVPQNQRSGLVKEAEIGYYRGDGAKMLSEAFADGMDVVNMSVQKYSVNPDGTPKCSDLCSFVYDMGYRAALNQVAELGMALVACAGNKGASCTSPVQCQTTMPGSHFDVISVAALWDTQGQNYPGKKPFEMMSEAPFSPEGWSQKTLFGGGTAVQIPTVGLIAFGYARGFFTGGSNGYFPVSGAIPGSFVGTSVASPQVASLATAFRQWAYTNASPLASYAWYTEINVLLMGDGRCGSANYDATYPNVACNDVVSSLYGFGFPRYFVPNWTNVGNNGGWTTRTGTIVDGQTISWTVGGPGNEASSVLGWKFALAVDVKGDSAATTNLPDLDVRVVDLNTGIAIRKATRQGNRYMMQIRTPSQIQGKNLEVRVKGTHVRAGGEVYWAADLYFSNAASQHVYVP